MTKARKCYFYNQDGSLYSGRACPKGTQCIFAHPGDLEWDRAEFPLANGKCNYYNDDGTPRKGQGCPSVFQQRRCKFVHPGNPSWITARPTTNTMPQPPDGPRIRRPSPPPLSSISTPYAMAAAPIPRPAGSIPPASTSAPPTITTDPRKRPAAVSPPPPATPISPAISLLPEPRLEPEPEPTPPPLSPEELKQKAASDRVQLLADYYYQAQIVAALEADYAQQRHIQASPVFAARSASHEIKETEIKLDDARRDLSILRTTLIDSKTWPEDDFDSKIPQRLELIRREISEQETKKEELQARVERLTSKKRARPEQSDQGGRSSERLAELVPLVDRAEVQLTETTQNAEFFAGELKVELMDRMRAHLSKRHAATTRDMDTGEEFAAIVDKFASDNALVSVEYDNMTKAQENFETIQFDTAELRDEWSMLTRRLQDFDSEDDAKQERNIAFLADSVHKYLTLPPSPPASPPPAEYLYAQSEPLVEELAHVQAEALMRRLRDDVQALLEGHRDKLHDHLKPKIELTAQALGTIASRVEIGAAGTIQPQ